jgi:serine/threonine protein kinase
VNESPESKVAADEPADALESLVGRVADEFLARKERGEAPDPEEFAALHPDAADLIRRTLAALRLAADSQQSGAVGAVAPELPEALGDYRIVREIGRGGMGVVYEAEQLSLRRRVALKVLPFAAVMDPRHFQRFKNEATAAAALDHPNVVKVYAVGCERGVHFIAMQFIDGRSLAELIRERRGEQVAPVRETPAQGTNGARATGPRTPTDDAFARRVAGWGAAAAEGLEHAHSLGVVHRDIKPGNLLIDSHGALHVADFGLARVSSSEGGVTGTGDLLGTPRYMSPEQASARHNLVDHRSDIYSLGATLYELLTLEPAVPGTDPPEILRRLTDFNPVSPRSRERNVPRDLETVVLKCLDKDPARRYQSAGELAADLRRFLTGSPVRARRTGPGELARKWVRRNPALAAFVALAVLSVAALVTGLLWHNERLRAESEKTARERDAARKAQRASRRAVNDMYTKVAEEWLADSPYMTDVQKEFLAKALEFYEEVAREPGAEPEDRLELGRALDRITHLRRGDLTHQEVETILRESARILEALVAEHPDVPEYRLELVRSCNQLGRFLVNTDQFRESETVLGRAITEAERLHRGQPGHPEYRIELATGQGHLGILFLRSEQFSKAKGAFLQSHAHARWLVDHWPAVTRYRELLAITVRRLGRAFDELKMPSDAEECFRQAVDQLEPLTRQSSARPSHREVLAQAWLCLGGVFLLSGKLDEAERAARQSVSLRRGLQEDYSLHPPLWHARAESHALHGDVLARLGRFPEAEAEFATARSFQQKIANSPTTCARRWEELAVIDGSLAWLRLRQSGTAGVRELISRLQMARSTAPAGERFRLTLIGLAHYRLGEWERALTVLREAEADLTGNDRPCRWTTDQHLLRRTAEHQEEVATAVNAFCLAMTYQRLARPEAARDCYHRGLRLVEAQRTPSGFRSVDVDALRAEAAIVLGFREQAPPPRPVSR